MVKGRGEAKWLMFSVCRIVPEVYAEMDIYSLGVDGIHEKEKFTLTLHRQRKRTSAIAAT